VNVDDLPTERGQRHRNELEVRESERDPDDREAEQYAGDEVGERQPPAREQEPEDVADGRGHAVGGVPDDRAPERPQRKQRDAQRGDPEGDRDDQDEHDQRGKRVADRHPQAGKPEPEDAEHQAHGEPPSASITSLPAAASTPASRPPPRPDPRWRDRTVRPSRKQPAPPTAA